MEAKAKSRVLMIVASSAFDESQYRAIRQGLEKMGAEVQVASTVREKARGLEGMLINPDLLVDEVDAEKFDGMVIIGGHGCSQYWHDAFVHKIIRQLNSRGALIAAIGRAPVALGVAGILKDKKATGSVSIFEKMSIYSKEFTTQKLEVDGNIITAEGNAVLNLFVDSILSWFAKHSSNR